MCNHKVFPFLRSTYLFRHDFRGMVHVILPRTSWTPQHMLFDHFAWCCPNDFEVVRLRPPIFSFHLALLKIMQHTWTEGWVYFIRRLIMHFQTSKKNKFWYKLTSRTSFLRMILINKNIQYGVQNGLLTLFLIYRLGKWYLNKIFEPLVNQLYNYFYAYSLEKNLWDPKELKNQVWSQSPYWMRVKSAVWFFDRSFWFMEIWITNEQK